MAYMGGNESFFVQGMGEFEQLTPGNPAAGAAVFTFTVPVAPAAEIWLPHSFAFSFTADANVATRQFVLSVNNGVADVAIIYYDAIQYLANEVGRVHLMAGLPSLEIADPTAAVNFMGWLWPWLLIQPSATLSLTVRAVQVGDQLSDITLNIQKWRVEA